MHAWKIRFISYFEHDMPRVIAANEFKYHVQHENN